MTKAEMWEMENRIRMAVGEPKPLTDDQVEEIKRRAFEAYKQYLKAQEEKQSIWEKLKHLFKCKQR